jgi:hypothetical protein
MSTFSSITIHKVYERAKPLPALPVAGVVGTCIYWMTLTSRSLWFHAIGDALFLVNLALLPFSLLSLASIIVSAIKDSAFCSAANLVSAISSFLFSSIALSLSTGSCATRYAVNIADYCARPNRANETEFCRTASEWRIARYVKDRTDVPFALMAGFVSVWAVLLVANLILMTAGEVTRPMSAPLFQPDSHSARPSLDIADDGAGEAPAANREKNEEEEEEEDHEPMEGKNFRAPGTE